MALSPQGSGGYQPLSFPYLNHRGPLGLGMGREDLTLAFYIMRDFISVRCLLNNVKTRPSRKSFINATLTFY